MRSGDAIDWVCTLCSAEATFVPDLESTRIDEPDLSLEFLPPDHPMPSIESSFQDPATSELSSSAHEPYLTPDHPMPSIESSLEDPAVHELSTSCAERTYQIIEQSTKRGRQKLIDSMGYTYNVQRRRGAVTDWQCTVRPQVNPCRATVRQQGPEDFQPGGNSHNHPAQAGAAVAAKVTARVKAKAVEDIFKPASVIVDEVILN